MCRNWVESEARPCSSAVHSDTDTGRYAMIGSWELTFTSRFSGESDTFAVQFEVEQGGRILYLTKLQATGLH